MQDFWLLNGFFLAIGLVYITFALVFIFSTETRHFSGKKKLQYQKNHGYNLLATGILISMSPVLMVIVGQSINLLVVAAINITVTLIALRLNLFDESRGRTSYQHDSELGSDLEIETEAVSIGEVSLTNGDQPSGEITAKSDYVDSALGAETATNALQKSGKTTIEISSDLWAELMEIAEDPAVSVDQAIRWWLRRRTLNDDFTQGRRGFRDREAWRSQQQSWND